MRSRWLCGAGALLATCFLFSAPATAAQWSYLGPYGTSVRSLAADPTDSDILYAGTVSTGVFVSRDGGANWSPTGNGLPIEPSTGALRPIFGLATDPQDGRLYALAGTNIVYSDNQGVSWAALNKPSGAPGRFEKIWIDPGDSQTLIVQNVVGLFRTTDRGATWNPVSGISQSPVWDYLVAHTGIHYAAAGTNPMQLYCSLDAGVNWGAVGPIPGKSTRDLAHHPNASVTLFVATDTGCYTSSNDGQDWEPMDASAPAEVHQFHLSGNRVLGVGRGGLYGNPDDPTRLDRVHDFYHTRTHDAIERPDGSFLIATEMGIFIGDDDAFDGTSGLVTSHRGVVGADVSRVVPVPNSDIIYAATGVGYDAGVYRSDDGGQTWSLRSLGLTNPDIRSIAVSSQNPDLIYAGSAEATADTGEPGSLYRSTDGGQSWTDITANIPHTGYGRIIIAMMLHPTDPDRMWVSVQAKFGGMYTSQDGGETFIRTSAGLESMPEMPDPGVNDAFGDYFSLQSIARHPSDPDQLLLGAAGCWGGTYRTYDGGWTWERRAQEMLEGDGENAVRVMEIDDEANPMVPGVHLGVFDIDFDPTNPERLFATSVRGAELGNGLFGLVHRSDDGGDTWHLLREAAKSDYFGAPCVGLAIRPDDGTVFLAARDGVRRSTDHGDTWVDMNEGLGSIATYARDVTLEPDDPNVLYLSTAFSGIWKRDETSVPVRLAALGGQVIDRGVELNWTVADAVNHDGFHIDREVQGKTTRLTDRLLRGETSYRFVDEHPVRGERARYWVVEVDRVGGLTRHGPVEVTVPQVASLVLGRALPNPFSTGTELQLSLPGPSRVTVGVFDTRGRRVAELLSGTVPAGDRTVSWNGRDDHGRRVSPGLYFLRAAAGDTRAVRKVVVLP